MRRPRVLRLGEMMQGPLPDAWRDAAGIELRGITADSRRVEPGFLFAAVAGSREDGARFIGEAVARGAVAVLARTGTAWPHGVPRRPLLQDAEPRRRLAWLAAGHAGRQPRTVLAVTGTNGKTSTVEFLRQLFANAGHQAASLGTLGLKAPGFPAGPGLTTPDPVSLAASLAALADAGIDYAALEASSHGLAQYRLDGVRLAGAAFTNLTRDHLDYHGDMASYRAAKLRLFAELLPVGAPVVAGELDPQTGAALAEIAAAQRLAVQTVGAEGSLIRLLRAVPVANGQRLELAAAGARHDVVLPLPGRFQADNALLAAGLAQLLGIDGIGGLGGLVGVRGRMELAAVLANGAAVYVDYAHTPDALTRLLAALRPHTAGRLVVVFGAGGDRDAGKRPLMGAAAVAGADLVFVTDDNPRSEAPGLIRAAIMAGAPGAVERGDRATAIADAMAALAPGDVLAVAGKGHEQGQTIGPITIPFDDVAVVRHLAGLA